MTDRSVNAAIWFGLEQISAAFWGQNNPALPICGGKRTVRSTAKYFRSKKKNEEKSNQGRKREITWWWAAVIRGCFPNGERSKGVVLLIHQEQ